eukprot:4983287-Amphidinium_carterae.2
MQPPLPREARPAGGASTREMKLFIIQYSFCSLAKTLLKKEYWISRLRQRCHCSFNFHIRHNLPGEHHPFNAFRNLSFSLGNILVYGSTRILGVSG